MYALVEAARLIGCKLRTAFHEPDNEAAMMFGATLGV
jgi:hypothetical protein